MTNDIETRKKYMAIAAKLATIADASDVDGDELAELLELDELVLLQKQIAKAIERKVIG
jgi:hypothetical protein